KPQHPRSGGSRSPSCFLLHSRQQTGTRREQRALALTAQGQAYLQTEQPAAIECRVVAGRRDLPRPLARTRVETNQGTRKEDRPAREPRRSDAGARNVSQTRPRVSSVPG